MAVKVDSAAANEFRKLAKETGMEQGMFLQAMIEIFRLNEDKTLYKEHADDIRLMRDLTATVNYKYVSSLIGLTVYLRRMIYVLQESICCFYPIMDILKRKQVMTG